MKRVRHLVRNRWSGGALALCVAYSLAIQALLVSVGLGMSAAATPGQAGFVIRSFVSGPSSPVPATDGGQNQPAPRPQCPFCFVAAQSAGHLAAIDAVAAFAVYGGFDVFAVRYSRFTDELFVPPFRRTVGDPRAPPTFSV